jgi:hypothetical protein
MFKSGAWAARKRAAWAISSGVSHSGSPVGSNSRDLSVSTQPGLRPLTRGSAGHDNAGALSGKGQRNGAADASVGAGNEGDVVLQKHMAFFLEGRVNLERGL